MSETIKYDAWLLQQLADKNAKCKLEKQRAKSAPSDCKTCVGSNGTQPTQNSKKTSDQKINLYPWEQDGFDLFGATEPQQQFNYSQSTALVTASQAEFDIFKKALAAAASSKAKPKK